MAKGKPRGSYTCGKCGIKGHNARKCPTKEASKPTTIKVTDGPTLGTPEGLSEKKAEIIAAITKKAEPADAPAPAREVGPIEQVVLSKSQDLTKRQKNTRPARPPSPYDCPTCKRVGVLVLVELEDETPQLRCEHCHNQVKCNVILKWGAAPIDKPATHQITR